MMTTLPVRRATLPLLLVSYLILRQPIAGQDPPELPQVQVDDIQVHVEVKHIELSFVVRDKNGGYVPGLSARDFALWEDGSEKAIVALREQKVPINTLILIDTSISIGPHLASAVQSALDFFGGLENESTALAVFSESPRIILDWDQKRSDLSSVMGELQLEGKTALYDSVISVAQSLFPRREGKKLLLLFTDGINTMGSATFRDMIEVTRDLGVTLYPILYTNDAIEDVRRKMQLHRARPGRLISGISRHFQSYILLQNEFEVESLRYGGRVIFSDSFSDLREIYGDIIREMKSHYVMLYESDTSDKPAAPPPHQVEISTRRIPGKIFINISR